MFSFQILKLKILTNVNIYIDVYFCLTNSKNFRLFKNVLFLMVLFLCIVSCGVGKNVVYLFYERRGITIYFREQNIHYKIYIDIHNILYIRFSLNRFFPLERIV